MKKKPTKPKKKPQAKVSPDAGLPAADQQIAKHNRTLKSEEDALRKEICKRVGKLRDDVEAVGLKLVDIANEARAIGLLINEAWDKLPGKQMTTDFWEQQQELYLDHRGRKIELDWLKWMVKVSRELPEKLEAKDLRQVWGMRQPLFAIPGFHLEGEAPYLTNGGGAGEKNFFTALLVQPEKFTKTFILIRKSLEADNHFGPVSKWRKDQREMAIAKVKPLFDEVSAFMQQLEAV